MPTGLILPPTALSTPAGATTTVCLPITYRVQQRPLAVFLTGTRASWALSTPEANPNGGGAKSTLATYSGSGNELLAVPPSVRAKDLVNITWTMLDPGTNIIGTESDSLGNNLLIITDTVGSIEASKVVVLNNAYLQVISQGPWTISISSPRP